MFNFRKWLMDGLKDAVGKLEDYQIILNATGWYEKGVLLEEDLAELQRLIDEKNNPVVEETPVEESTEDTQDIENAENEETTVEENSETEVTE